MVEIDWQSLPSVRARVDSVYSLAGKLRCRIDWVRYLRLNWDYIDEFCLPGAATEEDGVRANPSDARLHLLDKLIEDLERAAGELTSIMRELSKAIYDVTELLDYSFPTTIGPTKLNGVWSGCYGRSVCFTLDVVGLSVLNWVEIYMPALCAERLSRDRLEKLHSKFPLPEDDSIAIRARLLLEHSQVLRDLPAYAALHADPATEERQKKLAPAGFPDASGGGGDEGGDALLSQDGLYEKDRVIVWGGRRFDDLSDRMVRVLKVLVDAHRKGLKALKVKDICEQADVTINGGFVKEAFKVSRGVPEHEAAKLVEIVAHGKYRLIEPDEVGKLNWD
jgi:hypothetical protein